MREPQGEIAHMAYELGLEEEFWEHPNSLIQYEHIYPFYRDFEPENEYDSEDDAETYGAVPLDWKEIEKI